MLKNATIDLLLASEILLILISLHGPLQRVRGPRFGQPCLTPLQDEIVSEKLEKNRYVFTNNSMTKSERSLEKTSTATLHLLTASQLRVH